MDSKKNSNLNTVQSAVALVRRWFDETSRWLVVRVGEGDDYRLIEAARLEQESFRESIDREIAWQLRLRRGKDYIISSVPRLHLELPIDDDRSETKSEATTETSLEIVEFYLVELFGKASRRTLDENEAIDWWEPSRFFADEPGAMLDARQRHFLQISDVFGGKGRQ